MTTKHKIVMTKAHAVKTGDVISTDGLIVQHTEYDAMAGGYIIEGICHGVHKRGLFVAHDELPIWKELNQ